MPEKRRRRLRLLMLAVPIVLVVLGILLLFAPLILNFGGARAILASTLENQLDAAVKIQDVRVSWGGPQTVTGLAVVANDGGSRAELDIVVSGGLIGLLKGAERVEAHAEGMVETTVRADGSVAIADIVKSGEEATGGSGTGGAGGASAGPSLALSFANIDLIVGDEVSSRSVRFQSVSGNVEYVPGQTIVVNANGVEPGLVTSSFSFDMSGDDLLDASGGLSPAGASITANLGLVNVPLLRSPVDGTVQRLDLQVRSDDLSKRLIIDGDATFDVDGVGACDVDVAISHDEPFDRQGAFAFDPTKIVGTIDGRVPASIVQPWLVDTPIDIARDIGSVLTIEAALSGRSGEGKEGEAGTGTARLSITGDALRFEGTGGVDDDGVLRVEQAVATATVATELAEALGAPRFDAPASVRIEISDLVLPPRDGNRAMGSASGRLLVTSPVNMLDGEGAPLARLDAADLMVGLTPGFEHAQIDGTATVNGSAVQINGIIDDVLSADASRQVDIVASGVPTALADRLGDFRGLLVDGLGEHFQVTLSTSAPLLPGKPLRVSMTAPSASLNGSFVGGEGTLVASGDDRLVATIDLGTGLGRRLFAGIHPIFADVHSSSQPMQITVTNLELPTNGDVSRLDADIEITLGDVQIRSGSLLFGIMAAFEQTNAVSVPAYVEPVTARIRDGKVTYDRFAVRLDQQELIYTGTLDLSTRTIDLRTEYPLSGLSRSFRELRGYADGITVPLVTRGTLDSYQTTIDPEYKLEEDLVREGLKGLLKDVLGGGDGKW